MKVEHLRQINLGRKHTEETKAKMRKAWETRIVTPEAIKNAADARRGKKRGSYKKTVETSAAKS